MKTVKQILKDYLNGQVIENPHMTKKAILDDIILDPWGPACDAMDDVEKEGHELSNYALGTTQEQVSEDMARYARAMK